MDGQSGAPFQVQGAYAFRGIELMSRQAEQCDARALDIDGDFAYGLGCVGVKQNLVPFAEGADRFDGLNHADLVVGHHYGDEAGLRTEAPGQFVEADQAVGADSYCGYAEAFAPQELEHFEHAGMLDRRADDVGLASLLKE